MSEVNVIPLELEVKGNDKFLVLPLGSDTIILSSVLNNEESGYWIQFIGIILLFFFVQCRR